VGRLFFRIVDPVSYWSGEKDENGMISSLLGDPSSRVLPLGVKSRIASSGTRDSQRHIEKLRADLRR